VYMHIIYNVATQPTPAEYARASLNRISAFAIINAFLRG
jgi:hypothetical protein